MKAFRFLSKGTRYDQLEQGKDGDLRSPAPPPRSIFSSPFGLALHALIAVFWVSASWYLMYRDICRPGLHALEFGPVASSIQYQDIVFKMSGMGTREHPVTEYEGPPTPENNVKWFELLDEPASDTDSTPLIQLEVFHQLHCLNSLRRLIYNTSTFTKGVNAEMHMDHCIDYLRQSIMCHSDVTPLVHIPRPGGSRNNGTAWIPNFAVKHTCRDFWKIHEWAAQYNTSGWTIEGYPNQGLALAE
ncbi:DNA-directed DNA polymerase, family B, conserved site [Penicillium camemberti]|uniref:DNA-directed DNA polymerase, family B, conserved site n=1 Tax=Penicillium camemberti (strain FM 013) TaxID=1429867 RepID=A0A0G4P4T2_PENC3|nr:DNA-directed DNA polymerase, family B, conserved site [Penicillium camemberti]